MAKESIVRFTVRLNADAAAYLKEMATEFGVSPNEYIRGLIYAEPRNRWLGDIASSVASLNSSFREIELTMALLKNALVTEAQKQTDILNVQSEDLAVITNRLGDAQRSLNDELSDVVATALSADRLGPLGLSTTLVDLFGLEVVKELLSERPDGQLRLAGAQARALKQLDRLQEGANGGGDE